MLTNLHQVLFYSSTGLFPVLNYIPSLRSWTSLLLIPVLALLHLAKSRLLSNCSDWKDVSGKCFHCFVESQVKNVLLEYFFLLSCVYIVYNSSYLVWGKHWIHKYTHALSSQHMCRWIASKMVVIINGCKCIYKEFKLGFLYGRSLY